MGDASFDESAFRTAKVLNGIYTSAIGTYETFQMRYSDKLLLWTKVKDVLETSKKQQWGTTQVNADYETLPTFSSLKSFVVPGGGDVQSAIDAAQADPESLSFVEFGKAVRNKRDAIETHAQSLIDHLESSEFEDAFDDASYHRQVSVALVATNRLSASRTGRDYLADLFKHQPEVMFDLLEPPGTTAPSNGPSRLAEVTEKRDKLQRELPLLVFQLVPGVLRAYDDLKSDGDDAAAEQLVLGFQLRAWALLVGDRNQDTLDYSGLPNPSPGELNSLSDFVATAEWSAELAKTVTDESSGYLRRKGFEADTASGTLVFAVAGLAVLNAVVSEQEDLGLTLEEGFGIAKATADLAEWSGEQNLFGSADDASPTAKLLRVGGLVAGIFFDLVDLVINVVGAFEAGARGDESVVVGYSLGAAGAALGVASTAATIYGTSLPELIATGPPGWAVALVAGVIVGLTVISSYLIIYTTDHPVYTWMENNAFSNNWEHDWIFNYPAQLGFWFNARVPYGLRRTGGSQHAGPNYLRQVSALTSLSNPLHFSMPDGVEQGTGAELDWEGLDAIGLDDDTTYWHARFKFENCKLPPTGVVRFLPLDYDGDYYRVGTAGAEPHFVHQFPLNAYAQPEQSTASPRYVRAADLTDQHVSDSVTDAAYAVPPKWPDLTGGENAPEGQNLITSWTVDCFDEDLENVIGIPESETSYTQEDAIEAVLLDAESLRQLELAASKRGLDIGDVSHEHIAGCTRERVELNWE